MAIVLTAGSMNIVFAESISWKSEYLVGILNYDNESQIPITVTTFSKDSLKVEWSPPTISANELLEGYEIQRKSINTEFSTIVPIYDSKKTVYVDSDLEEGYYAYNVIPIINNQKADEITTHGIDRYHILFLIYMKGQELLAENTLKQNCIKCFDEEFNKIDNTFKYEFSEITKRQNSQFQDTLSFEITKAKNFFGKLFDVKNNH